MCNRAVCATCLLLSFLSSNSAVPRQPQADLAKKARGGSKVAQQGRRTVQLPEVSPQTWWEGVPCNNHALGEGLTPRRAIAAIAALKTSAAGCANSPLPSSNIHAHTKPTPWTAQPIA